MQYDVFISYARKDYADEQTKEVIPDNIVSRIRQLFDDNDITYWFDETGIYSGDQFVGVLADAIEQSSIFLYISTEASNASKWTINEIATAKHLDKKIIPFRYDGAKYNNAILMYLAPLDYIDYSKQKNKAFKQLLASVQSHRQQLEREEEERSLAVESQKQREKELAEKMEIEKEKQCRIKDINTQLDDLNQEILKKKQEISSLEVILGGLEKRQNNLLAELTFLTVGSQTLEKDFNEEQDAIDIALDEFSRKCSNFRDFLDKKVFCIDFGVKIIVVALILLFAFLCGLHYRT